MSVPLPRSHCSDFRALFVFPLEIYHLGVSGITNIRIMNGIGKAAPSNARFLQSRYMPAMKQTKIPEKMKKQTKLVRFPSQYRYLDISITGMEKSCSPVLPKAVGKRPRVPRTSACIVSPRYTGNESDAMPTQNPHRARPASTMATFAAREISSQAETISID